VYTNHILEVYKVDSSILETLLRSFILTNTRFLFYLDIEVLVEKRGFDIKEGNISTNTETELNNKINKDIVSRKF